VYACGLFVPFATTSFVSIISPSIKSGPGNAPASPTERQRATVESPKQADAADKESAK